MMAMSLLTLIAAIQISATGEIFEVPGEYQTISAAVEKAHSGGTVKISPGVYRETIVLEDNITLEGEDPSRCIIESSRDASVVTIKGQAVIRGLTIRGGKNGVWLEAGTSAELQNCSIENNKEDGVGFASSFETYISIRDCRITGNGDGIDLESTQAVLLSSQFVKNRDDGLDLDGDAGVLIYDCSFIENGDDGIEIRLAVDTQAIVDQCRFSKNGEDGIEIIDSPIQDGIYNVFCIQNSAFEENARHGVGFVDQEKEIATEQKSKTVVWAVGNTFLPAGQDKNAVSENYRPVFEQEFVAGPVSYQLKCGEKTVSGKIPIRVPHLVAIYNLRPTPNGLMAEDVEGVAVTGDRLFVADDNCFAIHAVDRGNGCNISSMPTRPFASSDHIAPGPEGLDIRCTGDNQTLILSDDDGRSIYELSLEQDSWGHILKRWDTTEIGPLEGVEISQDGTMLGCSNSKLLAFDLETMKLQKDPVELTFEGLGKHIAGAALDDNSDTGMFYVSLSGYTGGQQKYRHGSSAFFELTPSLDSVTALWHLGPFSSDPRGLDCRDGLIYIGDGRSDFEDQFTGEMNRGGMKIFVFKPVLDDVSDLLQVLPHLPVRKRNL